MAAARSSAQSESDQPGLDKLREAVANAADFDVDLPSGRTLRSDAIAGLNSAVNSVPDGMASGILAGVNPVYGLYAAMAGPIAGGIFSSSRLMIVTTTSASALAAGQALSNVPAEDRASSLFLMVILVGLIQVVLGLLRLGRLTRFVSYSVMTGFIAGIAVLTVLTQLPTATATDPSGGNNVTRTFDLLAHANEIQWLSLGLTMLALVLAVGLPRTPLGNMGMIFAIAVPSALVIAFSWDSVQVVHEVGNFSGGLPQLFVPGLSDIRPEVITGAIAVALIVLVQGAGVSQSVPNPDGTRNNMSRDFVGQGAGNIASGLIHGVPVGGSLGSTALNVLAGGRSRWAAIFAGCWVGVIVILLPGVIGRVAMPTLAALLIVASAAAVPVTELKSLWRTGWGPRVAVIVTFWATLLLDIQYAVGLGIILSVIIHLYRAAADISIVELVEQDDGRVTERKAEGARTEHRHGPRRVRQHVLRRRAHVRTAPPTPLRRRRELRRGHTLPWRSELRGDAHRSSLKLR